jgi:hypothetical protein
MRDKLNFIIKIYYRGKNIENIFLIIQDYDYNKKYVFLIKCKINDKSRKFINKNIKSKFKYSEDIFKINDKINDNMLNEIYKFIFLIIDKDMAENDKNIIST